MKKKIVVALIDSGISNNFIEKSKIISEKYEVRLCKNSLKVVSGGDDIAGHGTLCASTIYKECSDVTILSIKIFNDNLETNVEYLEKALEFLLDKDVQIINLSISLIKGSHSKAIYEICKKLNDQGKIIVSSVENGKKISSPADYKFVIGVRGSRIKNEIWFSNIKRINCIINSVPYLHMNVDGSYSMYGDCNSYAAAKLTGIMARMMINDNINNEAKIKKDLQKNSYKKFWIEKTLDFNRQYPIFKDDNKVYKQEELDKLAKVVAEFFHVDIKLLYKYSLYSSNVGGKDSFYYNLLKYIQDKYDFHVENYSEISKYNFNSIYTLYDLIRRNKDVKF